MLLFLADVVVTVHFLFVLFVVTGGLLVPRWPRAVWVHVPAAAWGALLELFGWTCPLTPLEVRLRELGGGAGYQGGFIDRYLMPILYPEALTAPMQRSLGLLVIAVNLVVYAIAIRRWRAARVARSAGSEAEGQAGGDREAPGHRR